MNVPAELIFTVIGSLFALLSVLHRRLLKQLDAKDRENKRLYEACLNCHFRKKS